MVAVALAAMTAGLASTSGVAQPLDTTATARPRSSTGPAATARWLVTYRSGARGGRVVVRAARASGARVVNRLPALHTDVLAIRAGAEGAAVRQLRSDPAVRSVRRDPRRFFDHVSCAANPACLVPNDPGFHQQWYLQNDAATSQPGGVAGAAGADIDAPLAWHLARSAGNVRIAIVDSGIDTTNPDLAGKVVANATLTSNLDTADYVGHGTFVAGLAGAMPNNGIGIAGVGYGAALMNIKASDDFDGENVYCDTIASGILYAAQHGAQIINVSAGAPSTCSLEQQAVNYAWTHGSLVVAAAGNEHTTAPSFPAADANVIAVAATDNQDRLAGFSNASANWVDLAAPGVGIVSTRPTYDNASGQTGLGYDDGTSFAAPIVSGVAALLWPVTADANHNGRINDDVAARLFIYADRIAGTGTYFRYGRVNACRAIAAGAAQCPPLPAPVPVAPPLRPTTTPAPTPAPNASAPPTPAVPTLAAATARTYARTALRLRFGRALRHVHQLKITCYRDTRTRMDCNVSWWRGPYDYWGQATVWLEQRGGLAWFDKLSIKRASNKCLVARPRRRCPATTFH